MMEKILAALGPQLMGQLNVVRGEFQELKQVLDVVEQNQRVLYAQGQRIEAQNARIEACLTLLSSSRQAA